MLSVSTLRNKARIQMKGRYFTYLGISLVPQLVSSVASTPITLIGNMLMYFNFTRYDVFEDIFAPTHGTGQISYENFDEMLFLVNYFKAMFVPLLFITLATALISYLLVLPVIVGTYRWYIRARENRQVEFLLCFSSFRKNRYLKTVAAMTLQSVLIMLWSFLLIIPGIIKYYAYRMVPFILADNPQIGVSRALKLSNQMTKGHKFDLFILDLSFIGWYILGFLACIIGIIAVVPYHQATFAEAYDELKKQAVSKNMCTMEELGYELVEE